MPFYSHKGKVSRDIFDLQYCSHTRYLIRASNNSTGIINKIKSFYGSNDRLLVKEEIRSINNIYSTVNVY